MQKYKKTCSCKMQIKTPFQAIKSTHVETQASGGRTRAL